VKKQLRNVQNFFLILKRDHGIHERLFQKLPSMRFLTMMAVLEHFGKDALGRDDHGHASKSIETM